MPRPTALSAVCSGAFCAADVPRQDEYLRLSALVDLLRRSLLLRRGVQPGLNRFLMIARNPARIGGRGPIDIRGFWDRVLLPYRVFVSRDGRLGVECRLWRR